MTNPKQPTQIHCRPIRPSDHEAAAQTLTAAFTDAPFTIWIIPDPVIRTSEMSKYWPTLLKTALKDPSTFIEVTDDLNAVAIWSHVPVTSTPSSNPEPTTTSSNPETKQEATQTEPPFRPEVHAIYAGIAQNAPEKPYLSLDYIGSTNHNRGSASALLRHRLDQVESGVKVALWTGTKKNIAFYERFGFRVYATALDVDLEGGQNGWWMVREGTVA
ncbi:hypothetical protein BCR33DRAFT_716638 [Rhizoclosmatium globosum]|uniref:N-acetyltransferase domain-containing protein n=1 Tax=Rhizoclosmatium globosum TaxID=329046 RepID=A0A1Y2CEK1_9FUNG|nr:hypothetical protein BCR33DRAFT_716638 [Rhizoclosmatium globosum]|eukprot:ORY45356.1 hypothetical protein BCR33DRAFT_716638 [Rhizoclosmatium globosum]